MGDFNLLKIDGEPVSGLGKTLIEKLERCLGWVASPKGTTPDAIDYYVEEIKNDKTLPPLQKSAMISNARKIIREYSNQRNIVNLALEQFDGTEKPDKLDDDWLSHFFDGAKHVSNEDLRFIWAKILSNECKAPGNTPKKLLQILSIMGTESAKCFSILSKFVMIADGDDPVAVIDRDSTFINANGLTFFNLLDLYDLGLIAFSELGYSIDSTHPEFTYHNTKIEISSTESCPVGNVLLTVAGRCLFQSILPEQAQDEYLKECTAFWERKGCEVKITKKA